MKDSKSTSNDKKTGTKKKPSEKKAVKTGKNILIFSDGTGKNGGKGYNTNVYKLFQMVEDRTNEQIAFYDAGLGTGRIKTFETLFGVGIVQNILQCYQFISDNYLRGDRIFLFGFSRGATTVRSLSGFINLFGILPHSRPDLIAAAWKIYETEKSSSLQKKARKFLERNKTASCNIYFIGVWDTVKALKGDTKFHDLKLSPCIQNAYHAMSIDEDRKQFKLVPWETIKDNKSLLGEVYWPYIADMAEATMDDFKRIDQKVKQVWFCGVHTDVGGGYPECGLSDISLVWMIDRATDPSLKYPLKLYPFHGVEPNHNISDLMHNENKGVQKVLGAQSREEQWHSSKSGKPIIHKSVLVRAKVMKDYKPWILELPKTKRDEEPWDQRPESYKYGLNIEFDLRFGEKKDVDVDKTKPKQVSDNTWYDEWDM